MQRVIVWNAKALVASQEYRLGNVIRTLQGPVVAAPTKTSIQVGPAEHIEDEYGAWMNHSCLANTTIIKRHVVATRTIGVGVELTFNYAKNETEMAAPFECFRCGTLVGGAGTKCPVYKTRG